MPLALSKTARTLNSWSPMHGELTISQKEGVMDVNTIMPPDDISYGYLGGKGQLRPAFRPTSHEAKANRRNQNRLLAQSKAMFENGVTLESVRLSALKLSEQEAYSFAEPPKPTPFQVPVQKIQLPFDQPKQVTSPPQAEEAQEQTKTFASNNNSEVHFQIKGSTAPEPKYHLPGSFSSADLTWASPALSCSSALLLSRHAPTASLAHLRKWNSQTDLNLVNEELPNVSRRVLSRNASLPDLRQADQLDSTKAHRMRTRCDADNMLIRSPSEMGRSLTFWVASVNSPGSSRPRNKEGTIKSFQDTHTNKRNNYEQKLRIFRNHWFDTNENGNLTPPTKISAGNEDRFKDDNSSDLTELSSTILASELTILGKEILLAVEAVELIAYVMKPGLVSEETCPNLDRLLAFYHRLTSLVVTEVLRSENSAKRAQIMALFVDTAQACHCEQNWQGSKAILAGLQCPPVVRLRKTWSQMQSDYPDQYNLFQQLTGDWSDEVANNEVPRKLSALPYFGDVLSRIRGRPTVSRLRPARALWREPPSLAKWVEEQIAISAPCDTCLSKTHQSRACCYLVALVMGKGFFCPVRRMPTDPLIEEDKSRQHYQSGSTISSSDDSDVYSNLRLDLAKVFDDPESLPFTSSHIECCALQPQHAVQIRRRIEICLRSAQATARAYDLKSHPKARDYLLRQPYRTLEESIQRSWALEVKRK